MHLIEAFGLAILLSVGCVLIHYEVLAFVSRPPRDGRYRRTHVIVCILGMLVGHLIEAALFAFGYWFAIAVLHLNGISAPGPLSRLQYMYFSIETFTTQGVGDVYAVGPLRMVASIEPLIGLVLVGWSTAFTFQIARRMPANDGLQS